MTKPSLGPWHDNGRALITDGLGERHEVNHIAAADKRGVCLVFRQADIPLIINAPALHIALSDLVGDSYDDKLCRVCGYDTQGACILPEGADEQDCTAHEHEVTHGEGCTVAAAEAILKAIGPGCVDPQTCSGFKADP